jgi:predicted metal-dependent HD superfamily phosphohydrolase
MAVSRKSTAVQRTHYRRAVPHADLADRWRAALPEGVDPSTSLQVYEELRSRWDEPHRHYHNREHLESVLSIVEESPVVSLAAWFHDAVYDPRRDDNEEASARLAVDLLGTLAVPADEVARLVRLTAIHDPADDDRNGALLTDADLAILAAEPARYERYTEAVRREYSHLPDQAYRVGRAAVLRRLLAMPALFRVVDRRAEWEVRARANLDRELARLAA